MTVQEDFEAAQRRVKDLSNRPSNEVLLKLYSLYKQGMEGDVSGKKPGRLNIAGRAKFEAWESVRGMDSEEAKEKYIELVDALVADEI